MEIRLSHKPYENPQGMTYKHYKYRFIDGFVMDFNKQM